MNTGTAATRATVRQAWAPVLRSAGAQGQELGQQILDVAHQVAVAPLRGPLTDPGREPDDKADLARRLFTGKVDDLSLLPISEPTSNPRNAYAGFCLKKKNNNRTTRQ